MDKKAEDMVEPCNGDHEPVPQGTLGCRFGDREGGSAVTSAPVIPAGIPLYLCYTFVPLKLAKRNLQLELSLAFC